jgi:tetratricopeptide (TPR) repeat protein
MSEFTWGDQHPLAIDHQKRKYEADQRAARKFVEMLSTADEMYLRDAEGVREGLALYDRESAYIRHWQAWAARVFTANPDDTFAAQLCRMYAAAGIEVADLRLGAAEKIRWHEVCLAASRRLMDRHSEGGSLSNLGGSHLARGDARKALGCYEQALAIAQETGDRRGVGRVLGNLGHAWAALGDARKTIEFSEQALGIAMQTGDRETQWTVSLTLATALHSLGRWKEAIPHAEHALIVLLAIGSPHAETVRQVLAQWRGQF